MRLIADPYIFSRRSKRVVSSVFGGRNTGSLIFFVRFLSDKDVLGICSATTSASSAPESASVDGLSFSRSSVLSLVDCFESPAALVVGLVDFLFPDADCFLPCSLGIFFLSRLRSMDNTVGGNCIGSPARINFLALKIGIQHTLS